jgi:hypothetical protein
VKPLGISPLRAFAVADWLVEWWAYLTGRVAERRAAAAERRAAVRPDLPASLATARAVALLAIALLSAAATAAALAESYRNLYEWAIHHHVFPGFAWAWPLTVDSFVVIPELVLFVAMVDIWFGWSKVWPWLVIAGGLSASVAGNIGSLGTSPTLTDQLTAAASPTAAFVALTFALAVLKRVIARARAAVPLAAADDIPPTTRDIIKRAMSVGIADTGTLAALSGVSERHVQRLKNGSQQPAQGYSAAAATSATHTSHRVAQPRLTVTGGRP